MLLSAVTALLVLLPAIVSAAIFPPDTKVRMLDPKSFRRAMQSNVGDLKSLFKNWNLITFIHQRTSVVAFVAPWCGVSYRILVSFTLTNMHTSTVNEWLPST